MTGALRLLPGLFLLGTGLAQAFPEGSDPGYTGFDGQPDCGSCHYAGPDPGKHSGLSIKDLPERIKPGSRIEFRLQLRDPHARVGGFQMLSAVPTESGEWARAGQFQPGSGQRLVEHEGLAYLGHAKPNEFNDADDGRGRLLEWIIHWQAPDHPGPVSLYASAVAADDDQSALGDNAYRLIQTLQVHPPGD